MNPFVDGDFPPPPPPLQQNQYYGPMQQRQERTRPSIHINAGLRNQKSYFSPSNYMSAATPSFSAGAVPLIIMNVGIILYSQVLK